MKKPQKQSGLTLMPTAWCGRSAVQSGMRRSMTAMDCYFGLADNHPNGADFSVRPPCFWPWVILRKFNFLLLLVFEVTMISTLE